MPRACCKVRSSTRTGSIADRSRNGETDREQLRNRPNAQPAGEGSGHGCGPRTASAGEQGDRLQSSNDNGRGLLDSLAAEVLGAVKGITGSNVAFCVTSYTDPTKPGVEGWVSVYGVVKAMSARDMAVLLSATQSHGARELRHELVAGHDELVTVSFGVQSMRVCAGIARHGGAQVDPAAIRRMHDLVPMASRLGALRAQCFEHERRDLVLRALRSTSDACCVLDLDARRVCWIYDLRDDQVCSRDILRDESSFVDLAERFHLSATLEDPLPYTAAVGRVTVVRTADLGRPREFDASSSLAIALSYFEGEPTKLSARERQIAQLLANGYSTVNAAAILSLSENTIRTYVRRLYRKLEITNRSDLTRKYSELGL
jgi:DNA-binding CsgD family transcriptional regulator